MWAPYGHARLMNWTARDPGDRETRLAVQRSFRTPNRDGQLVERGP